MHRNRMPGCVRAAATGACVALLAWLAAVALIAAALLAAEYVRPTGSEVNALRCVATAARALLPSVSAASPLVPAGAERGMPPAGVRVRVVLDAGANADDADDLARGRCARCRRLHEHGAASLTRGMQSAWLSRGRRASQRAARPGCIACVA